jgi:hypothetical protein
VTELQYKVEWLLKTMDKQHRSSEAAQQDWLRHRNIAEADDAVEAEKTRQRELDMQAMEALRSGKDQGRHSDVLTCSVSKETGHHAHHSLYCRHR